MGREEYNTLGNTLASFHQVCICFARLSIILLSESDRADRIQNDSCRNGNLRRSHLISMCQMTLTMEEAEVMVLPQTVMLMKKHLLFNHLGCLILDVRSWPTLHLENENPKYRFSFWVPYWTKEEKKAKEKSRNKKKRKLSENASFFIFCFFKWKVGFILEIRCLFFVITNYIPVLGWIIIAGSSLWTVWVEIGDEIGFLRNHLFICFLSVIETFFLVMYAP